MQIVCGRIGPHKIDIHRKSIILAASGNTAGSHSLFLNMSCRDFWTEKNDESKLNEKNNETSVWM